MNDEQRLSSAYSEVQADQELCSPPEASTDPDIMEGDQTAPISTLTRIFTGLAYRKTHVSSHKVGNFKFKTTVVVLLLHEERRPFMRLRKDEGYYLMVNMG